MTPAEFGAFMRAGERALGEGREGRGDHDGVVPQVVSKLFGEMQHGDVQSGKDASRTINVGEMVRPDRRGSDSDRRVRQEGRPGRQGRKERRGQRDCRPGIAETKAIAEEGFIYGLPIVMNYAVMYEFCGRQELRPVQGAVQRDQERGTRLHLQGHRGRHAQQRHALFPRCGWTCGPSRSCCRSRPSRNALLLRAALRRQHLQLWLHRQPGDGQRRRATTWSSGPTGKARPAGHQEGVSLDAHNSRRRAIRTQLFNPADMPNVVKVQDGLQGCSRSRRILKQPAPPAAPAINFPKIDKEMVKTNFFEYLDFALAVRAAGTGGEGDPGEARADRRRAGQDVRLQGPVAGAQGRSARWHEGRRGQGRASTSSDGREERQRLEDRLGVWRPRVLQRRLAAARGRGQGGHLRQRRRRGDLSHDQDAGERRRRSTAASTTTRSPSPRASSRRSTPSGR